MKRSKEPEPAWLEEAVQEVRHLEERVHLLETSSHRVGFSVAELTFAFLAFLAFVASLWGVAGLTEFVWSDVVDQIVAAPLKTTILAVISAIFLAAATVAYHFARSAEIKGEEIAVRGAIVRAKITKTLHSRDTPRSRQTHTTG